jgi:CxxC motif-containing protein (DUF1111 family)
MVVTGCALLLACGQPTTVGDSSSDLPLTGLDDAWQRAFDEGDRLFDVPFRAADGLGPLYIRPSCSGCHEGAARGPGTVKRMVQLEADGTPTPGQPALAYGSVERPFSTSGATPLLAPALASVHVTTRSGIPVMGRGWLEAISEAELERLVREQALRTDGISGRINHVRFVSEANPDTPFHHFQKGELVVGRFGLKARQPTLDDFAADALQGDMGLTSPMRPREVANQEGITDDGKPGLDVDAAQLNALGNYVRLIAIPPRRDVGPAGRAAFERAGCATCHVPSLRTRDDYPLPQLAGTDAPVFTDLLLHDMGPALADGITDGEASPREWRTAPLIGVRFLSAFLHDGRTDDLQTAIELHGGEGSEARGSVELFHALPEDERAALLQFVSSL